MQILSHPKHIKINIPFNLASRIITITNSEELRDTRLRELRLYLKNQQYPEEIVEHGVQKALEKGPIHTELREQVHVTSNQRNVYFNMFRVTGSEIKIHMGVSIFRENVRYYVVIC
jgi:hypothetical protein